GVVTISTSTATTISTAIPTSATVATASMPWEIVAVLGATVAAARGATSGSIIPHIAGAPLIGTGRPRTGLGARRALVLSPTARPAPGSRLAGKAATCPAIVREGQV